MRCLAIPAMVVRMKRLPRRHRIAHLRALIRRLSACASRRQQLLTLLREEMSAQPDKEDFTELKRAD